MIESCRLGRVLTHLFGGQLLSCVQNDMMVDSDEILAALDLMAADPTFKWNHECVAFVRAFIELHPDREAEMVSRLVSGQFDVGGTFSEPFEQTVRRHSPSCVGAFEEKKGCHWTVIGLLRSRSLSVALLASVPLPIDCRADLTAPHSRCPLLGRNDPDVQRDLGTPNV